MNVRRPAGGSVVVTARSSAGASAAEVPRVDEKLVGRRRLWS